MIIYKITFPNGKIYIGQTILTLSERKYGHYHAIKKFPKIPIARAFKKFKGSETWEIIDMAKTLEELNAKETYWIKKLNSCIYEKPSQGYNCNYGGNSRQVLEVTKNKISKILKGHKLTPEQRERFLETQRARVGKPRDPEIVSKVVQGNQRYWSSDKFKQDIEKRASLRRGKTDFHSIESRRKNAISKGGKPFHVLKDGKSLGIFYTLREATLKFGLANPKICLCLKGKKPQYKGFTFRYALESEYVS